jgi:hypothetical protein
MSRYGHIVLGECWWKSQQNEAGSPGSATAACPTPIYWFQTGEPLSLRLPWRLRLPRRTQTQTQTHSSPGTI